MMCMFKRPCECGDDNPSIVHVPPGVVFRRSGEQKSLYFVRCNTCGKRTADYESKVAAAEAWNREELENAGKL
jgi:hypothetical protein